MPSSFLMMVKDEIQISFIRSAGPGGQNVNKVSTSVQLRLDVRNSPTLTDSIKERLSRLAGKRMTEEGVLVIEARRFRTQEANRQDAMRRLGDLLERAARVTSPRKPTLPTPASRNRRLDEKHRRGISKRARNKKILFDEL